MNTNSMFGPVSLPTDPSAPKAHAVDKRLISCWVGLPANEKVAALVP